MPRRYNHKKSDAGLAMKTKSVSKRASSPIKLIGKESVNSCLNQKKSKTINVNSRKFSSASTYTTTAVAICGFLLSIFFHNPSFLQQKNINSVQSSSSNNNNNDGEKDDIAIFLDWFHQNGGFRSTAVTISKFVDFGGHGLLAKSDIKPYDILFKVPKSIIITSDKVKNDYFRLIRDKRENYSLSEIQRKESEYEHMETKIQNLLPNMASQDAIIAQRLMAECALGERSLFEPYLRMLPNQIPRLDTFVDKDLEMLQDPQLSSIARQSVNRLQKAWKYTFFKDLGFSIATELNLIYDVGIPKTDFTLQEKCLSFESFHRFVAIVSSRAMVINGKKYLTPLAGMINYAPRDDNSSVKKQHHLGGHNFFNLFHQVNRDSNMNKIESESITVRADRQVKIEGQIFEDYGDVDNSLFLEAHGFVPDYNPSHCAMLTLPSILPDETRTSLQNLNIIRTDSEGNAIFVPDACVYADGHINDQRANAFFAVVGLENEQSRNQCLEASRSSDREYAMINCVRYKNHQMFRMKSIQAAALVTIQGKSSLHDDIIHMENIQQDLDTHVSAQTVTALKFRIKEKEILHSVVGVAFEPTGFRLATYQDRMKTLNKPLIDKSDMVLFHTFVDGLGLNSNSIKAHIFAGGLRIGAVATQDIKENDTYHSFPNNSTISESTILTFDSNLEMTALLQKAQSARDEFHSLLFFLIHHKFILQEQSTWWPYLNLLPTIFNQKSSHPLWFNTDQLDFLAGSDLRNRILNYQKKVSQTYASLLNDPDVVRALSPVFTFDHYVWAHSILDARSIWWDGKRHLVPLLDFVNCEASKDIHSVHESSSDTTGKYIETKARKNVLVGEQVFEDYGQPNHIYFLYHGFILDNNLHDCALIDDLSISSDDKVNSVGEKSRKRLHVNGFNNLNPSFCIRSGASSELDNLANFLRIKKNIPGDNIGVADDICQEVVDVIKLRVRRYIVDNYTDEEIYLMDNIHKMMVRHLQNEKNLFEKALKHLTEKCS